MFAKRAQFNIFGRDPGRRSGATAAPSNDNHSSRRSVTNLRQMPRPILVCGWRKVPATGALECFWQVESDSVPTAEEPGIGWRTERVQRGGVHSATKEFWSAVA